MSHLSIVMLTFLQPYAMELADILEVQVDSEVELIALVDARAAAAPSDDQRQVMEHLMASWRVVLHDPRGNWGQHRNSVLAHISVGTWVAMLDDDERVDSHFIRELRSAIEWAPSTVDAFYLPRLNTFGELSDVKAVDWLNPTGLNYPDLQGRVFRHTGRNQYRGRVHESLFGYSGIYPLLQPRLTLVHHKTEQMQERSNNLWQDPNLTPTFYSQCLEDKFLDFILQNFDDDITSTVAELGAGHPIELSNSRYLIERGWSALLVEASPLLVDTLALEYRSTPNVEVLNALIAGRSEMRRFHSSSLHWALSGVDGLSQSSSHQPDEVTIEERHAVLASSVVQPWLMGRKLGVLAIHLEGSDTEVLRELLSSGTRPQVVIIEALTHEDRVAQDELLRNCGYEFLRNLNLSNAWLDAQLPRAVPMITLAGEFDYA